MRLFAKLLLGYLLGALLAALIWLLGLLWFIGLIPQTPTDDPTSTDAIVALTGGKLRLDYALELLAAGKGKKLLISGVPKGAKLAELYRGKPSARFLSYLNDHYAIALGHEAYDTKGNAREASDWMRKEGYTSMRLVTANYHMPRSLFEFRRLMPDVTLIPEPVFPEDISYDSWWHTQKSRERAIFEYHKYILTRVHGLFISPESSL